MPKKRYAILAVFIIVSITAAACGGGGGHDIAVGPAGSETQVATEIIMEAYGIEDYNPYYEGFGDASDQLQDGNVELSFGILGLPAGGIDELNAVTGDVQLLNISEEALNTIEENSNYERLTIPADSYDFLEEDVETISAYAILVGNTDTIDEELGYELARIMVEHVDENTHDQSQHMTLENALNGSEQLPLHPGAYRYYEEQGMLNGDEEVAEISAEEGDRPSELVLGTGSSGGTYFPLGGEMAGVWNNHLEDTSVNDTETDASVQNLGDIRAGDQDIGMTVHTTAINALNSEGDFEDDPVENIAFIGHIYPEVMQIVTREDTNIESLDDLVD